MKKNIFNMYNPILENEERKKYISLESQDKRNYQIKFRKKYIRKLLDDKHRPNWNNSNQEDYKNIGALVEYMILEISSKQDSENIKHCRYINDTLKEDIQKLKAEIELLK